MKLLAIRNKFFLCHKWSGSENWYIWSAEHYLAPPCGRWCLVPIHWINSTLLKNIETREPTLLEFLICTGKDFHNTLDEFPEEMEKTK